MGKTAKEWEQYYCSFCGDDIHRRPRWMATYITNELGCKFIYYVIVCWDCYRRNMGWL